MKNAAATDAVSWEPTAQLRWFQNKPHKGLTQVSPRLQQLWHRKDWKAGQHVGGGSEWRDVLSEEEDDF